MLKKLRGTGDSCLVNTWITIDIQLEFFVNLLQVEILIPVLSQTFEECQLLDHRAANHKQECVLQGENLTHNHTPNH